jgi:peptidoglycan hydrolase CwlO-like protein
MKKSILPLVLACLVMVNTAIASTVTVQDAQTVATNFFRINVPSTSSSLHTALLYTQTEPNGAVDFYVFSVAPAEGFR